MMFPIVTPLLKLMEKFPTITGKAMHVTLAELLNPLYLARSS